MIATVRTVRLILHLLVGMVQAVVINLDFTRRLSGERAMSWWCNVLLDVLNIQLLVQGEPARGARFSVANHVSWLDMILIGACEPTRFVSKAEVKDWPILGFITRAAGTFYLRRGKGGTVPLMERLVPHLASGGCVTVFPEGTTTDGRQLKPFFPRLFAAAIDAGCLVQPIALRYGPGKDCEDVAPFIGDDDMVSHLLRVLRTPELQAELVYGKPFRAAEQSREQLAERAQQAIRDALGATLAPLPASNSAAVQASA